MGPSPLLSLSAWHCMAVAVILVLLASGASARTNATTLSELFWQLRDANTTYKHVDIGGQNFTTCCLKAVQDSIEVTPSGDLQFRPNHEKWITFYEGDDQPLDLLFNYSDRGQFPCGASYSGDLRGAPVVKVNYTWLADNCRGWQVSSKDNLNAWLQPLSGFLVPAVIFCLSVPRRRRLEVPRSLFSPNQGGIKSYPFVPFGAVLAMIMVCVDTIYWLCVCFAFSGPMIISGLYEAMLDNAVLEYLRLKTNEKRLTIDMRCRCLMVILIGNLDIAWNTNDPSNNGGFVDGNPQVRMEDDLTDRRDTVYGGTGANYQAVTGSYGNVPLLPHFGAPGYDAVPEGNPSAAGPATEGAAYASYSTDPNYRYETASAVQLGPVPQPAGSPSLTGASSSPMMNAAAVLSSPLEFSPQPDPFADPGPVHIIPPTATPSPTTDDQDHGHPSTPTHLRADVPHGYPPTSAPIEPKTYGVAAFPDQPAQQYASVPSSEQPVSNADVDAAVAAKKPVASPWKHMEEFIYGLRLYDDDFPTRHHSPRQYGKHQGCPCGSSCTSGGYREFPRTRTNRMHKKITQTKKRLRAMLLCQYSFGSMIGAPVVFFLGGFIFALLQSLDAMGNEDIAIGLAFGQWYMTIPHIALVSGLLLAGNNPNILEGVLADDGDYLQDDIKFLRLTYGLAYPSCYKVADLWHRGYNKKKWLRTLGDTYCFRRDFECGKITMDDDIIDLMEQTSLSLFTWGFLLILALTLLVVPFILAFLTAFYTPEIGLSCRSLTFVVYLSVQLCQIILWLWAYADPLRLKNTQLGHYLIKQGFFQPHSWEWLEERNQIDLRHPTRNLKLMTPIWQRVREHKLQFLWCSIYFVSQLVLGLIGVMAAIGATLMNLIGVYTANTCTVTTRHWFTPYELRPQVVVSTNSAEMIAYAMHMWKPCAITAIVFMSVVTFFGWWYQRRMRDMFTTLVWKIDDYEREDTCQSRVAGGFRPPNSTGDLTEGKLRRDMPTAIIPPPSVSGSASTPAQGIHLRHLARQQSSYLLDDMASTPGRDGVDTFRLDRGGGPPSSAPMQPSDSFGGYSQTRSRTRYSRATSLQDPYGTAVPQHLD